MRKQSTAATRHLYTLWDNHEDCLLMKEASVTIATVDFTRISPLVEIIVRAGDFHDPRTRERMRNAYNTPLTLFPGAIGLSCLFRPGATLDELAREGAYPNPLLSYTTVDRLQYDLAQVEYRLVLFITPTRHFPDHHTLAVAQGDIVELSLADAPLDALLHALIVVHNPYQTRKP